MSRKFQRTIEDFICGHCGAQVHGNGYTNHCPACLWSRHVDINPGDRAAVCGGLMEPISLEGRAGEWVIHHRCQACGFKRPNRAVEEDDKEAIIRLSVAKQ